MPHRTEVMGFMTFLHGDDRFYNNIFVQKWPSASYVNLERGPDAKPENREVGTHVFDEYPTYEAWIAQFDFANRPNMRELEAAHFGHLPVWSEGNAYLNGAKAWKSEVNGLQKNDTDVFVELSEQDGGYVLNTNVYEKIGDFGSRMIHTDILGKAFEPEQPFENADGTPIRFDADFFGNHRGVQVVPGPFAAGSASIKL
jgi:hypothetical protein